MVYRSDDEGETLEPFAVRVADFVLKLGVLYTRELGSRDRETDFSHFEDACSRGSRRQLWTRRRRRRRGRRRRRRRPVVNIVCYRGL